MKRTTIAITLCLALMSTVVFAGEWSGLITETKCGAAHKGGSEKDISCVKSCIKSGAGKAALPVGDDLFTITNADKAAGHEGHKVKVTGTADEKAKTLTIETIEMEK